MVCDEATLTVVAIEQPFHLPLVYQAGRLADVEKPDQAEIAIGANNIGFSHFL